MIRLLRRLAMYVVVKTGPVMMVVTPSCSCGRRFQVVFEDIGPILLRSAAAKRPLLSAELREPNSTLPRIGGDDAFRS